MLQRLPRRSLNTMWSMTSLAVVGAVVCWVGLALWSRGQGRTSAGAASVPVVSAGSAEFVQVQGLLPERREISRQIELPATLEAFDQATLYAKASGYLKWIKVDLGDRVHKGEVLAEMDVPEMIQELVAAEAEVQRAKAMITHMQAESERAKAEMELKKITYERLQSVRQQEPDVMPQQQVDEAKAQFDVARALVSVAESKIKVAQSEMSKAEATRGRSAALGEYSRIRAPFDGVVIKRFVDPGALIQQASTQNNVSPVVTVARVDFIRVFVEVPEPNVRFIKKGMAAALTVDAVPGKTFDAQCTRFATALDPKTRTMRTEVDVPNPLGELRPGMFGAVRLTLEQRRDSLAIPANALVIEGNKFFVYTVEQGKAKRVEIKTGLDDGIRIEITSGLTGKYPVIIAGKSAVKDGTPVRLSETK